MIHSSESGFFLSTLDLGELFMLLSVVFIEFLLPKYAIIYLPILLVINTELFLALIIRRDDAMEFFLLSFSAFLLFALPYISLLSVCKKCSSWCCCFM